MQITKTCVFEPINCLEKNEVIVKNQNLALASGDYDLLLSAVVNFAKVKGLVQIAHNSGLRRENLNTALGIGAKPRIEPVLKILQGMGVQMQPHPMPQRS
jgi:probable addiction module antidote protein